MEPAGAHGRRGLVVAAVLFFATYVASLFAVLDLPEGGDSDSAVQAAFTDERGPLMIGIYLLAISGLSFICFLGGLRNRLEMGVGRQFAPVIAISGSIYVTMLFAAAAMWAVLPMGTGLEELPTPIDADTARVLTNLGFTLLLIFGLLAAAVMIVTSSIVLLRGGLGPRWFAWGGFVVGALLLLGPTYMPQLLVPLWVLGAAFMVDGRRGQDLRAATT